MDIPNIAVGARFWSYHLKPADNGVYFTGSQKTGIAASALLWNLGVPDPDDTWFAPTQILITFVTSATAGSRSLTLIVTGRDQFGFPVSEIIEFDSVPASTTKKLGTQKCYVYVDEIIVDGTPTVETDDTYGFGIGSDDGIDYRLPTPARVRSASEVLAVQEVFQNKFYLPTSGLTIDVENQALQVDITGDDDKNLRFAVLLEPKTTSI